MIGALNGFTQTPALIPNAKKDLAANQKHEAQPVEQPDDHVQKKGIIKPATQTQNPFALNIMG